jgi:SMI1 / KNR4 family (SUKH-1)
MSEWTSRCRCLRHAWTVTEKDRAIRAAEQALSVRLPEDYASWLGDNDGLEQDLGGCYLSLYAVEELVERNHGYGVSEFMPGLLLIGSDGGSEGIGLDMRGQDSPVVMVGLSSLRWEEAIQQAESFDEFLEMCYQVR